MKFPENFSYTKEHMWAQEQTDGTWAIGITDYAQDLLGDIVFVDPPKLGSQIQATTTCGLIESVKTGSDLHAPIDGTVVALNEEVANSPELINENPYLHWIFKCKASNTGTMNQLLSASDYKKLVDA
ncbi:MAG: glycine cleavage system protein GcvH [Methylophilus sp.]